MNDPSQNEVYKLVHRGGGPTFVANQLRVSSSTIHGGRVYILHFQLEQSY